MDIGEKMASADTAVDELLPKDILDDRDQQSPLLNMDPDHEDACETSGIEFRMSEGDREDQVEWQLRKPKGVGHLDDHRVDLNDSTGAF